MASAKAARLGEEVWKSRTEKISQELLTLTYGTLVSSLLADLTLPHTHSTPDYASINAELDRMGHSIGVRLIEDFLAKTNSPPCNNFRETVEMITKVGFKVFLNVVPEIKGWREDGRECRIALEENPLGDWVELPDDGRSQGNGEDGGEGLWYSQMLCGVIKGACEMVQVQVEAKFVSDVLRGDDATEMQLTLIRYIEDELPPDDE